MTSNDRILTTHVGSMPRPPELLDLLRNEDRGEPVDEAMLAAQIEKAVLKTVREQVDSGIDIVGDGEMSKMSYHVYAKHRLSGLQSIAGSGIPGRKTARDILDFPGLSSHTLSGGGTDLLQSTVCGGPVAYLNEDPLNRDISNLKSAAACFSPSAVFMTSASPGCLATYVPNRFYASRDAYREALAAAMTTEYNAIHRAGFILQLDCPDLAGARHSDFQDLSEEEFLADAEKSIEALNEATADIPPEAMRMHICWLNYPGPHTHDIPVARLFGLLRKARPAALLFEGANSRHEHEWEDWKTAKLSDEKVLVPGLIDSTSNFVEHPRLIAQRICRYADVVGRERVIAGADCGFGTYAGRQRVHPAVVLAKFQALAEGARLASQQLWS